MPDSQDRHQGYKTHFTGLILLSAVLLFPTILPEKIGWLASFVPLPIFYYLVLLGKKGGAVLVRNAISFSIVGAFLVGSMQVLIFSLVMVPLGIVFAYGVFNRKSPVETALTGFITLVLTWILFWSGLAIMHQTNPYANLLVEIDGGLSSGLMLYEESAELTAETMESVRSAVELLRNYIPKVLPSLLLSAILTIIWINLLLGDWLLKKMNQELTTWPDYIEWKLPDPLVWLVISAGITVFLLPAPMSTIGLNVLIVCSTVYFFQGLAIIASLFNKWSVPMLLRILIYALIFIQTYGIIILAFVGLADVWADFRKLNQVDETPNNSV